MDPEKKVKGRCRECGKVKPLFSQNLCYDCWYKLYLGDDKKMVKI